MRIPAGITQEALEVVKKIHYDCHGERLTDKAALFLVGMCNTQEDEHFFRYQTMPSKVMKGIVHKGYVRNQVNREQPVVDGKINYTETYHPLARLYEQVEIVTGDLVSKYAMDILEIGDITSYKEDRESKEYENYKNRVIKKVNLDDYEL